MSDATALDPVRVLVADDNESVRRAIARLVTSNASLELVGVASDAEEAVEIGSRTHPDVALVDVQMPKGGGMRAARELRECSPATKVVALSGSADREGVLEMISTGAVGYLVKGAKVDVVEGILRASRGEGVISNEVAADVIGELGGQLARQREHEESRDLRVRRIEQVITDHALDMFFQPIIDLKSGMIAGVEALARFLEEPYRTPDVWFEEAWSLGLGLDLELTALLMALEQARSLPLGVFLALNVSPEAATSPRFFDMLASVTVDQSLVVELTEHAVVDDYETLIASLDQLRESGMRVAVDDAGAGYASLRHVLYVKPEIIKLDISLIAGIDKDQTKLALAESITAFARGRGTKVVAEGIETVEQLHCVSALDVDYAQGFLLGRPGPVESIGSIGDFKVVNEDAESDLRTASSA